MGTRQSTVDVLLDQLAAAGNLTTRRMFGQFCLYLEATPVAFIFDDQFFVRATDAGRAIVPDAIDAPPFPGARDWLLVATDRADERGERERLCNLLRATRDARPPFVPKKRRVAR